jgi:uncharacterized membrane protein
VVYRLQAHRSRRKNKKEVAMKKLLLSAAAIGAMLAATAPAQARDGCGPGSFRGPHGRCHSERGGPGWRGDRGPGWRGGPGPRAWEEGRFYPGRGYWSGGRWYQHRDHDRGHGGWRYR